MPSWNGFRRWTPVLHLAALYPQRCKALMVLASNVRPDGPLGLQTRARQQDTLAHGGMVELVRKQLAPVYGLKAQDPIIDSLVAQAQRVGNARFRLQRGYVAQCQGLLANSVALSVPVLALSA